MIVIPPVDFTQPVWTLSFAQQQRDLMRVFADFKVVRAREMVKAIAEQYAREYAKRVKDIIAAETDGTGRLAASYGPYQPGYLKAGYKAWLPGTTYDQPSSASDSVFYEETHGNVYMWHVGTRVPYAVPIMLGFTQPADGRRVYIPKYDRWITIHPFTYAGLHADERAMAEMEANGTLEEITAPYMQYLVEE